MAKNIIKSLKNASKTLRPKVTMVGNSLDIDSIYNHSIPKKVILKNNYDSWYKNMRDSKVFNHENFINSTKEEISDYINLIKDKYGADDLKKIEKTLVDSTNSAKLGKFMNEDIKSLSANGLEGKVFNYKGQRYVTVGSNTFGYLEASADAAPVQMQVINLDTNEMMNFGHEFKNPNLDASDAINDGFYFESIVNDIELTGETINLKDYQEQVKASGGTFNWLQERDDVINSINRGPRINPEASVDFSDPLSWTDDYILNTATNEETLNDMINQRDQAQRFKDINPDKPGTWTEEYINKTAKTPDELHDMTQRMREAKKLDTVEIINQQRKAEDVPKNRQQKRQDAKEGKGTGKNQKKKSKQQKVKEKRQQQFEARQKALGRDPEEVKNLNKEMNEKRKQQGKETREKKKLDAEKAKADKARAEKAYQDAMDKINGKTDLERMEFYNTTETERKYKFQQENQESLESLTENKGQVNDSNKYVHNQNFDDIDADINATQENINRGYKDVNGYTGNKLNSEMDNYFDGRAIYDTSVPRPERTIEEISESFDSYRANSKYFDDAGNPVKTRKVTKTFGPNPLDDVSKVGVLTTGMNILGTITDYKDERKKGHGVVSSAVRAGAKFAMYEALGLWAIPVALVSNAPGAIIKGADMLYKENRKMNSAANFQVFGGAQFMDTQQLATMRQSGMEMAKMANYNLQQTLMGNEATYLHR